MTEQAPISVHEPSGAPKGGIVVVQEAFGVNDHIEDVQVPLPPTLLAE
jgi:dienelactone hydrolase